MLFQDGLGLDIAEGRVTAVHLRHTLRGPKLAGHAAWPLEPGAPLRLQTERIGKLLKDFIAEHRLAGTGLFVGIPQDRALAREIRLPSAVRENLSEAIRYELDRYLPLPAEDLFTDHQLLEVDAESQQLRILLVAAKRSDLEPVLEIAQTAGVGIRGIAPANAGWANLVSTLEDPGESLTYLLVTDPSGDSRLSAIEKGVLAAWRSSIRNGGPGSASEGVDRALASLGVGPFPGNGPASMVICGDDPDGRLADTARHLDGRVAPRVLALERLPVPSWDLAAAYGLALGALRELPTRINLMPAARRQRPSRLGLFLLVGLAALAVLTSLGWFGSELARDRLAQRRVEGEILRLKQQVGEVDTLQKTLDDVGSRIAFLDRVRSDRLPALDILRELSQAVPKTAWLREVNVSGNRVRIDGYAEAAAELIPLLDASPRITDVAFLSAITRGRDGKEKFRIGFTVVNPNR